MNPVMCKATIFGAGGGLGKALTRLYESKHWVVHSVIRSDCDLGDQKALDDFLKHLVVSGQIPDLCIFSAGTSEVGYADEVDPEAYRHTLNVNFHAPVRILMTLAKSNPACKRFVFILSGAADLLVPGMSPYALSKRAFRDYLSCLKLERSFPDVSILAVWPGAIATEFNAKTKTHGSFRLPSGNQAKDPEEVAQRIFDALEEGRRALVLSKRVRLAGYLQALAPWGAALLFRLCPAFKR
jgi:short-subunit dehydrogenase